MTFINLYFENIEEIRSALPIENLTIIIKWTIKKQISDKIYNKSKSALRLILFRINEMIVL